MDDPAVIRAVALFGPVLLTVGVGVALRPNPGEHDRWVAALLLASVWCGVTLYPLNLLAVRMDWWHFQAAGATLNGVPVDLWLGWTVLWGTLPALLVPRVPATLVVAAAAWVDVALMPQAAPVIALGPGWLLGEALGLLLCLVPATLLASWTRRDRRLAFRSWAQILLAGTVLVAVFLLGWEPAWPEPVPAVAVQLGLLGLLPGLAAAREFARAGHGTPLPYDPPRRLVTTGPYAYVRNPMQLSMSLLFLVWAVTALDWRPLVGVVVIVGYAVGLASWHEDQQLHRSFGPQWRRYRAQVRPWVPRLRPTDRISPAVVYVAGDCALCRGVGRWVTVRRPVGLRIEPAQAHPEELRRLRYENAAGVTDVGVAALGRTLEHLHLGWALVGWVLILPGVSPAVQLASDAFGAGPRLPADPPRHRGAEADPE
ncbi:isoprenylcysteine carboxylmethyltransferase family protein [Lipingzhangella sp. LS1_29]|uniref:Isoprenylcysteine carboxylmethyltransferase family protein n=1 Tax=Lipingzhangella rawalii TaxID=2055835 RepID=A0ABU2H2J9_9ACTN|nr:isoprenylcysteine carboxylmethyltransferase family protein [Lipingzhangella rawalii]MDS1269521.1 isoprenylcysteine carboxylmethyltransferase family protein [Lipingzhangella rawalii]